MGAAGRLLSVEETRGVLQAAFDEWQPYGRRVLFLIPDGTRTAPMPLFFRLIHELLGGRVAALDYLIALGTHPPMSAAAIRRLVGMSAAEERSTFADVRIFNHNWGDESTFATLGTIPADETREYSEGLPAVDVPVRLNRMLLEYDLLVVCGPVFPHEVAGFSGGSKYFFPGVSGPEVINFTHWLGALLTSSAIIGKPETPVRAMIERAAGMIPVPRVCLAFVTHGEGIAGLWAGEVGEAWREAAALSAQVHIRHLETPQRLALAVLPKMYADIWTGAKGMYKVDPVLADGGEVILYGAHISEISYTHGRVLDEIGYHVRDYFVKQWPRFEHYPWGVLAHSTHLRGSGTYGNGVERGRIQVTLATRIPAERCRRLNLGWRDPDSIHAEDFAGREDEGVLLVPHAGEVLYRLKDEGK